MPHTKDTKREASLQLGVILVAHRLEPLVAGLLAGHLNGQMGEPAVGGSAMPMLNAGGNEDGIARMQLHGLLAPLLIVTTAAYAHKGLASASSGMMYVPIVAAAGLEGDVKDGHAVCHDRSQIALSHEILGIGIVGLTNGEKMDCA